MASVACKFESDSIAPQQHSEVVTTWQSGLLEIAPVETGAEEILAALSVPTLTNVIMAGFIRDNGLVNSRNRGRFYVCRNEQKTIQGVALIGHTVLFDAFNEDAVEGFASVARRDPATHLLMGEHEAVQRFWSYYADEGDTPRHVCPVTFLQCQDGALTDDQRCDIEGLRLAVPEDLEPIVRAQAAMALETSGVDPLQSDPIGFRQRYLRRIEQNRVWVLMKNRQLIFKLDVMADTPDAAYIEGVYVSPAERGKGLGQTCLTTVGRNLLERTKAIYLFVENDSARTKSFYLKLGFGIGGQYDLLYF